MPAARARSSTGALELLLTMSTTVAWRHPVVVASITACAVVPSCDAMIANRSEISMERECGAGWLDVGLSWRTGHVFGSVLFECLDVGVVAECECDVVESGDQSTSLEVVEREEFIEGEG